VPERLFSVWCPEKRGARERTVWRLDNAPPAEWLAERIRDIPSMFSNRPGCTGGQLNQLLVPGWTFYATDDVGLLAGGPFVQHGMGDVHITFWDRVLRGREELARRVAEWHMKERGYDAVYTVIPSRSVATLAFARRVGFKDVNINGVAVGTDGEPDLSVMLVYPGHYTV
jgi:hypothetical protein